MSVKGEEKSESMHMSKDELAWAKLMKQLTASVFFGVSSIMIITINKTVLTTFKFVFYLAHT